MKEQLLVLAKTYPSISHKYEHLVCVGGITDKKEWRRVYPIAWQIFWGGGFKKKYWIEYEKQNDERSDHRPESRKINSKTIKELYEADFKDIKHILDDRLTTLENLTSRSHKEVSMGVIKPFKILDFIPENNEHYEKLKEKQKQTSLSGKSVVQVDIFPKVFSYVFYCSPDCKTKHKIMCEDWELMALYRNCERLRKEGTYKDENEVFEKVKQRFLKELPNKRDLYFIVGTHYRFNTYLIVGVVYPRNSDVY